MSDVNSTLTKVCTKCGETKSICDFSKKKSSPDKHATACKQCLSKANAAWRDANKDSLKISKAEYHAKTREVANEKSRNWYAANKEIALSRMSVYNEKNREKARQSSVAWRLNNLQRSRDSVAAYQALHPEVTRATRQNRRARSMKAEGRINRAYVSLLMKLQNGKCISCKADISSNYHVDHIYPLSKGGTNLMSNLQLLCPHCNLSKSAKHPIDFMQQRGFLL